eukprot:251578_1
MTTNTMRFRIDQFLKLKQLNESNNINIGNEHYPQQTPTSIAYSSDAGYEYYEIERSRNTELTECTEELRNKIGDALQNKEKDILKKISLMIIHDDDIKDTASTVMSLDEIIEDDEADSDEDEGQSETSYDERYYDKFKYNEYKWIEETLKKI